jgi:hypothetical protein
MVESSSEEEEEAPTVVKRNYKLPKKKRRLTVAPPCRRKKYKKSAAKDSNDNDSLYGDSLPIAKASRRSPPTREPLRQISPTTVSQQKQKRSTTMNTLPIEIPRTGEELADLMGLAMMDALDTEEECIRAVNRIGDIVTGKFLAEDYEENLENEAPTVPNSHPICRTVIELPNTPTIDFTTNTFHVRESGEVRKPAAARQAKLRAVLKVNSILDMIGSPPQVALAVATALRRPERQDIGKALGIVESSDVSRRVADRLLAAVKEAVQHPAVLKKQTADSLSFQKTLLWSIVPAAVAEDASAEEKKAFRKQISETASALGMSKVRGYRQRLCQAAIVRRNIFFDPTSAVLLHIVKRGANSRFTPEFIADIRAWVLKCDKVSARFNNGEGVKKKERKCFYMFSVRDIHTELVKPVDQGGFAGAYNKEGKLIISDTALCNILPKNVSRMSDSQKQMCGCEMCLNGNSMMLALNSWRGRKKSALERRLAIMDPNTREYRKLEREVNHFLLDAFPVPNNPMCAKANDAMYSMTCDRAEGCDLVYMNCALGRCLVCLLAVSH